MYIDRIHVLKMIKMVLTPAVLANNSNQLVNMIYCAANAHNRNRSSHYSRVNHRGKIIKLCKIIHLSSLVSVQV